MEIPGDGRTIEFIGFNCFQGSLTRFFPPAWLMKKFGLKTETELATEGK